MEGNQALRRGRGASSGFSWSTRVPALIVTDGGNDAGGVSGYTQTGQDYGMKLLWTLILLFPILFCQEWRYAWERFRA